MRALRQLLHRLSGVLIGLVDHGCVPARIAIFWPDLVPIPVQGDHYDFHWDGARVDRVRNCQTGGIPGAVARHNLLKR